MSSPVSWNLFPRGVLKFISRTVCARRPVPNPEFMGAFLPVDITLPSRGAVWTLRKVSSQFLMVHQELSRNSPPLPRTDAVGPRLREWHPVLRLGQHRPGFPHPNCRGASSGNSRCVGRICTPPPPEQGAHHTTMCVFAKVLLVRTDRFLLFVVSSVFALILGIVLQKKMPAMLLRYSIFFFVFPLHL